MFKDFFQLYQIGKELGLNKKEIKKIFLFDNSKSFKYLAILLIVFIFSITIIIIILSEVTNTYPSGSYYSTVKNKDFKRRKRIQLRILRRT